MDPRVAVLADGHVLRIQDLRARLYSLVLVRARFTQKWTPRISVPALPFLPCVARAAAVSALRCSATPGLYLQPTTTNKAASLRYYPAFHASP